jgi:hypothetical protein
MSTTLEPPEATPAPLLIPNTSELRARLATNVREHAALRALLRVSLQHDKLQELRAKMEAASDRQK